MCFTHGYRPPQHPLEGYTVELLMQPAGSMGLLVSPIDRQLISAWRAVSAKAYVGWSTTARRQGAGDVTSTIKTHVW